MGANIPSEEIVVAEKVVAWILSFITTAAPVGRPQPVPETPEETKARYEAIAWDLADVVYDPMNPSLFEGEDGRSKTAAVLLSIMKHESDFRRDVDLNLGSVSRGDRGRSWCMMQINIGKGQTKPWNYTKGRFAYPKEMDSDDVIQDGWTGEELIQDRRKCILTGLRIAKTSMDACKSLPLEDQLRVYASGSCAKGGRASRARMKGGLSWYAKHTPTFKDADALIPLPPPQPDNGLWYTLVLQDTW